MPLTTIASRPAPTASGSRCSSSSVSLTGISSGSATATYPVCSGSASMSRTSVAWRRIGPTRAISPNVRGVVSMASPWPEAGASTTTRS